MRAAIATAPLCAFAMLMPTMACAQAIGVGGEDALRGDGAGIVVTANRAPVRLDRVGQSITVLTEEAIAASQEIGVTELLAQTPGVHFARNGGRGATTSLFIRGAETGQTVVLYDGVRLNDPSTTDGGASLADVTSANIGRIEVLRGAQSTLYGSQAIGGVVNIISKVPERALEGDMQLEAGGLDTRLARGGVGGRQGGLVWRVAGGYVATDGISAYAPGTEDDGYENVSLNGRLSYAVTGGVTLDLRSFYTSGEAEFDGFNADAPNRAESESWLNYAGVTFALFDGLDNRIAYTRTDIDRTNFDEGLASEAQAVTFRADGVNERWEYQGTLALADRGLAVFGVDYAENAMRIASPALFDPQPAPLMGRDDTLGVYGQVQAGIVAGLTFTAGLRQEEHSTFGGSTLGSAALAWSLNEGNTILRASWGEGFKAPSLYQLYSEYGNAGLGAEQAESWDVGIEQRLLGVIALSATYFERDSTNLIDFVSCTAANADPLCADGRFGFYANVDRVDTRGAELGAGLEAGAFSASANYTWLDAINTSPGDFAQGNRLARRPQHAFNAAASYAWPFGLVTGANVRIVGPSFNDAGNTQRIDGYIVADLRVSYPLDERVELYGRVENAFDEEYETVSDYGTLPRVVYGGVRLRL